MRTLCHDKPKVAGVGAGCLGKGEASAHLRQRICLSGAASPYEAVETSGLPLQHYVKREIASHTPEPSIKSARLSGVQVEHDSHVAARSGHRFLAAAPCSPLSRCDLPAGKKAELNLSVGRAPK